jgi:hypothetical protein
MDTVEHEQTKRMRVMWLAVALALIAAASYLLIQFGLLGVGDQQPTQQPAAIVFIAAAGYLLGGLLILVRRRWLWIVGAVINALAAWLSDAIIWEAIDASSVRVAIHDHGVSASAVLSVNEQGQPTIFRADRYMEEHGHYRLTPWSVQSREYREVEGMCIPTHFEVTWHLPSGDFTWLCGDITEIEYNRSGKMTTF